MYKIDILKVVGIILYGYTMFLYFLFPENTKLLGGRKTLMLPVGIEPTTFTFLVFSDIAWNTNVMLYQMS